MKRRIFLFVCILFFIQLSVVAEEINNRKIPSLKYKGSHYSLLYSAKVKEINGYTNEYFKRNESYDNWTELIAVHHFPNDYSPIDKAKEFQEYLITNGCLSSVTTDEDNNSATIDFVIVDSSRLPIVLEFNIFRYKKDNICGTISMQYAKRYLISNSLEIDKVKNTFERDRTKNLKRFEKLEFPELLSIKIENGKYILNESIKNDIEDITKADSSDENNTIQNSGN